MREPNSVCAEKRVLLVAEPVLDQMSTVDYRLATQFPRHKRQKLARLIERHRVILIIEGNKCLLIRLSAPQKVLDLLGHIRASSPMVGTPQQSGGDRRRAACFVLTVFSGGPSRRLMDDSPNAEIR